MMSDPCVTDSALTEVVNEEKSKTEEGPYAILWKDGQEILLYEDENGEFYTS